MPMPADDSGDELFAKGSALLDCQDMKVVRKELRKLRRGREILALRVKKARRELARTKKRQKEAERTLTEHEAAVAVISQRLGYVAESLPEIDEWKVLAYEHKVRGQELQRQISDESAVHAECLKKLQEEIKKGGRPETAKSFDYIDNQAKRLAADEHCGQIQAVRDYINGDLEGISLQELQELVSPRLQQQQQQQPLRRKHSRGQDSLVALGEYKNLIEVVLKELADRHAQSLSDVWTLSNRELGRKDALLQALSYNLLARGLEDMKLCTPAERVQLRELLQDVESICDGRLVDEGISD
eukprot:CAMPEP_0171083574 /NCGR_PEP_ID=MMETSP0766_2-20121228/17793_1 /TAXON_ID=439317 /ORGANISM="Gambierdiscus australes, Strain CAWD 149" /LENGTH=299 /DNA_ID=CAMNT_0011541009 /DNA_START=149 /DNA_END=1048 /DNA_ORIENTATION=+